MRADKEVTADRAFDVIETVSRSSGPTKRRGRIGFQQQDFIIYPAHGVGQILSVEEQTVADASLEFFVIYFAKLKLTVRVPTGKVASVGMRRPSDKALIHNAKQLLSETPRKSRGTWSRLALEYGSKIHSGDVIAIAEVVRDLYRPGIESGQSFSERQLYETALDRLSDEVALVEAISREQAVAEVEGLLKAGQLKRVA